MIPILHIFELGIQLGISTTNSKFNKQQIIAHDLQTSLWQGQLTKDGINLKKAVGSCSMSQSAAHELCHEKSTCGTISALSRCELKARVSICMR